MGYILPINSYQSQQYASRLRDEGSSYAKISQLHRINKIGDFMEDIEENVDKEYAKGKVNRENEENAFASSHSQYEVIGYENPNPINLSVKNVRIVHKDEAINAYR